jgi:hypothetical protein
MKCGTAGVTTSPVVSIQSPRFRTRMRRGLTDAVIIDCRLRFSISASSFSCAAISAAESGFCLSFSRCWRMRAASSRSSGESVSISGGRFVGVASGPL